MKGGASIFDEDSDFCTALHVAAIKGWADLIKPLFTAGLKTKRLDTPLHFAAYGGDRETVKVVLQCEREVIDSENLYGYTALHVAAFLGNADAVEVLINGKHLQIIFCVFK